MSEDKTVASAGALDQEALNEEASKELEALVAAEEAAQTVADATGAETDDAPHRHNAMRGRSSVGILLPAVS